MIVGIGGDDGQHVAIMPRQQKKMQPQIVSTAIRNSTPAPMANVVESRDMVHSG